MVVTVCLETLNMANVSDETGLEDITKEEFYKRSFFSTLMGSRFTVYNRWNWPIV